ncbi:hypothetical protein [Desulfatitalea alkaliphila]|uniref:Uncharacterized protein n=1 Tax=Desulfatitalea alkaliphila TaxID=2929485 RepID=A0AA41ULX9_9BACT|nr:hypothetical protein [Desulfatitalea alkaliphila]MCJ8502021.1 hypothetical protein [Desulfatitalea alkaliphila]
MHSAQLIRRARWYCLLSESALAWAAEENPQQLKHLVVFEHGQVRDQVTLQADHTSTAASGSGRSWTERRNNIDLAAYDRMRVVTTELRRVVGKGRNVQLRLGPKVSLASLGLQKALRWV